VRNAAVAVTACVRSCCISLDIDSHSHYQ